MWTWNNKFVCLMRSSNVNGNGLLERVTIYQSPEKCPTFLRLSNLHHKPSSSKTIKTSQVFELNIGYFLEALTVNGLYLSQSMSYNMKTLLKLDCRYRF